MTPFCVLKQENVQLQTSQENNLSTGGAALQKYQRRRGGGGGFQNGSGSDSFVLQRGKFKLVLDDNRTNKSGINLLVIKHDTAVMLSLNERQVLFRVYLIFYWCSFFKFSLNGLIYSPVCLLCFVLKFHRDAYFLIFNFFLQCIVFF